jgi:hypothetical protein
MNMPFMRSEGEFVCEVGRKIGIVSVAGIYRVNEVDGEDVFTNNQYLRYQVITGDGVGLNGKTIKSCNRCVGESDRKCDIN